MYSSNIVRFLLAALAATFSVSSALAQNGEAKPHFYDGVQVVCVGIDKHLVPAMNLNRSVADAQAVASVLEKGFAFGKAKLLLNEQATKQAILDMLEEIDRQPKPPEVLILYFACHGTSFEYAEVGNPAPVRVGFLVPHDARVDLADTRNVKKWTDEAISMARPGGPDRASEVPACGLDRRYLLQRFPHQARPGVARSGVASERAVAHHPGCHDANGGGTRRGLCQGDW